VNYHALAAVLRGLLNRTPAAVLGLVDNHALVAILGGVLNRAPATVPGDVSGPTAP
jgi:hypothetical protein